MTPKLTIHGTVEKITQQQAQGKGLAPLDGAQALPNSKLVNGEDGIKGIHISV